MNTPSHIVDSLPLYQCHKQVRAAEITKIDRLQSAPSHEVVPCRLTLRLPDDGFSHVTVSVGYMQLNNPQIGGFFLVDSSPSGGGFPSYCSGMKFQADYALHRAEETDPQEGDQKPEQEPGA